MVGKFANVLFEIMCHYCVIFCRGYDVDAFCVMFLTLTGPQCITTHQPHRMSLWLQTYQIMLFFKLSNNIRSLTCNVKMSVCKLLNSY